MTIPSSPRTCCVKVQRKQGKLVHEFDTYIGRACNQGGHSLQASKWHNPFSVTKYGREKAVSMYREYIQGRIEMDPVTYDLSELVGKRLGCWCNVGELCHGQILIQLIRENGLEQ